MEQTAFKNPVIPAQTAPIHRVLNLPPDALGRKRWTREQCAFLVKSDLLTERYELIDGEIILKMPQYRRHARLLNMISHYLNLTYGPERVQGQATMEVRWDDRVTNEPEPDLVALRTDTPDTPDGTDVLLAVEVADSSEERDLVFKRDLYARAGVFEYWVVDVHRRTLVIFRNSDGERWQQKLELGENEPVAPLSAPERVAHLADWFPAKAAPAA